MGWIKAKLPDDVHEAYKEEAEERDVRISDVAAQKLTYAYEVGELGDNDG